MDRIMIGLELSSIAGLVLAWIWFWGYMYVVRGLPFIISIAACYLPLIFLIGVFLP